jgi:exosortase
MEIKESINQRNVMFLLFFVLAFFVAYAPIKAIYTSSVNSGYYSHIVLIPLVSIYLVFLNRKVIFSQVKYSFSAGLPTLLIGVLLYFTGRFSDFGLNENDFTSVITFSAVVFINGAFIFCFGLQAFKVAVFPLLFLLFTCPIPSEIMERFIYALQVGSTEFANLLFLATGVPFVREGFVFHLPGMSVEVAKQCSGIRSALALFITALLAGHLFLNTWWKKVVLVLCIFPIAMFKNGIRIITLTLLGTYVDPRILQSSLHREGGIPFFIVALLLLAPILYFLKKSEKKIADRR